MRTLSREGARASRPLRSELGGFAGNRTLTICAGNDFLWPHLLPTKPPPSSTHQAYACDPMTLSPVLSGVVSTCEIAGGCNCTLANSVDACTIKRYRQDK